MALRVQSIDEITTELADIYDGLISPKKIWRNHNNKLYLMLRAYAAGKVGINDAALSLRNRFDPAYCDDVDLYSTAKLVGTDFKAGTGSLLQITIQNKSDETSQVLAGGVYHYTSASGEIFSFQITNDYQFDPRETKEVTAISSHKGSFSVTTNADIKLSRADGETIHSNFLFSCTGNEGQQGYADEDVFSFRGRILNDASRQDHIKELELSIRNLPNIFECNIKQNESYDTEEIYDGFTLKPRELLIMITGSPTNDIAKLAAGEVLYATHKVSDDMVVYYENDAYINGRYPVYYKFHDKTDFALYIKYQYDSNKLKAAQIEEAITALFKPYTQMVTHIDTFTEKNVYDVLAGILLPDVVILDANIIDSDGNEVPYISTPATRLLRLTGITYNAVNTGGAL